MSKTLQGIVLEVHKKHVVLMTPDGDCHKVAHPGGHIKRGEEISLSSNAPAAWTKIAVSAACLAVAALILITILPAGGLFTVVSDEEDLSIIPGSEDPVQGYLALDINPSLELSFDEGLEVTDLHPFNSDAVLLLEGLEKGDCLYETLELLVVRSVDLGYLEPESKENLVLVSLVPIEDTEISMQTLADLIEEKLTYYEIPGTVGISRASEQDRSKAEGKGISLNRHILLDALDKQDEEKINGANLPVADLLAGLKDKLPFSEYRTTVVTELPPQVPFDADDLPGPPELPVDKPEPGLPDQAGKKGDNQKELPPVPLPVPSSPDDKPGPPDSVP